MTVQGECVPVSRWSGMFITCQVYLERLLDRCSAKLCMSDTYQANLERKAWWVLCVLHLIIIILNHLS